MLLQLTLFIEMHMSARRHALTKFSMPAMSPTMTEGGIASWKKAEGETFTAGDVLLEIVCSPNLIIASTPFLMSVHRKRTRLPLMWRPRMTVFLPKLSYVNFKLHAFMVSLPCPHLGS